MNTKNHAFEFYAAWAQGTALYGQWAAQHGISYTELSVLYALSLKGEVTQKTLRELYGLPKQTVSNCVRHLEQEGYVELKAGRKDKRERTIAFTAAGTAYCEATLAPLFEIEAYISRNIHPDNFIQAIETRQLFNTLFEKEMNRTAKNERNED